MRLRPLRRLLVATLALCAGAAPGLAAEPVQLRIPGGGEPPRVLDALELDAEVLAIAFSPDGRHAAVASPAPESDNDTIVRLYTEGADAREVALDGRVRSLLFDRDGAAVLLVVHKPAKRRPGETQLARIDLAAAKTRRLRRLPSSAAGLDHWPARGSLLVCAENEIRTLIVDGLRSGPLYRVPGANRAIASLAWSDIVLVGQDDALLLLRLSDPPGPEQMPVRARVDTPAPVRELAASTDGRQVLARLVDDRVFAVRFGPLRLEPVGSGPVVSPAAERARVDEPIELPPLPEPALGATPSAAPPPPAATPTPTPTPERPAEPAPPRRPPMPAPTPEPTPQTPPPPGPTPAPERPAEPTPTPRRERPTVATPEPSATPPQPAPSAPADRPNAENPPQVRGRLTGQAEWEGIAVVLLGPSNLLREAARVRPGPDGRWEVRGVEPGTYRVQLDAGGQRVVVSDPAFVVVEASAGDTTEAPELRVIRSYRP